MALTSLLALTRLLAIKLITFLLETRTLKAGTRSGWPDGLWASLNSDRASGQAFDNSGQVSSLIVEPIQFSGQTRAPLWPSSIRSKSSLK